MLYSFSFPFVCVCMCCACVCIYTCFYKCVCMKWGVLCAYRGQRLIGESSLIIEFTEVGSLNQTQRVAVWLLDFSHVPLGNLSPLSEARITGESLCPSGQLHAFWGSKLQSSHGKCFVHLLTTNRL